MKDGVAAGVDMGAVMSQTQAAKGMGKSSPTAQLVGLGNAFPAITGGFSLQIMSFARVDLGGLAPQSNIAKNIGQGFGQGLFSSGGGSATGGSSGGGDNHAMPAPIHTGGDGGWSR